MSRLHRHVGFVPVTEWSTLFDHLIGGGDQRLRYSIGTARRLISLAIACRSEKSGEPLKSFVDEPLETVLLS
jgi:hypothetical protein